MVLPSLQEAPAPLATSILPFPALLQGTACKGILSGTKKARRPGWGRGWQGGRLLPLLGREEDRAGWGETRPQHRWGSCRGGSQFSAPRGAWERHSGVAWLPGEEQAPDASGLHRRTKERKSEEMKPYKFRVTEREERDVRVAWVSAQKGRFQEDAAQLYITFQKASELKNNSHLFFYIYIYYYSFLLHIVSCI